MPETLRSQSNAPCVVSLALTIKHWMRIAQKRAIDDACDYIGHLVRNVLPGECSNYFDRVP